MKVPKKLKDSGFIFYEQSMPQNLINQINALNYKYFSCEIGADSHHQTDELCGDIKTEYIKWLNNIDELNHLCANLSYSAHKFKQGEFMKLHTDYAEPGDYQILSWICPEKDFRGRDFLYGTIYHDYRDIKQIKPFTGLICLMDLTNPKFFHGVSTLESNVEIITVCGCF